MLIGHLGGLRGYEVLRKFRPRKTRAPIAHCRMRNGSLSQTAKSGGPQKQFGYCHSNQPRAYPVFHVEGFTEVTLPSHCYIGADLHLLGKHGVGFVKQPRKAGGGLMQPHSLDGWQRNRQGPFGVPRRPPFPVVRHTLLVGHTPNLRWRYRSTR
jgi:hypothetical protein